MELRQGGNGSVNALDVLVFAGLETLGTLAIIGNLSLIVVLLRNKYLNRASFILMLSLAIADVLHGIVTTCYFYPPILLKYQHISDIGMRLFNIVDWTAWAITLTHMSAICLDRLVAIMLYGRYNVIVTIPRVRNYSVGCWVFFLTTNTVIYFMKFCCIIQPLQKHNFYTFGYDYYEGWNFYVLTYTPIEIITICVLSVSNPITLVQLYRRHKRKVALRMQGAQKISSDSNPSLLKAQRSQWQRASTMLLEMSMKMGSRQITNDVREIAARRANRQQQRILLQISVVALIFYAYMTAYYISYYVAFMQTTAAMIFNSFFYSTTHMINPVIYFSLNKEMRAQLKQAVNDLFNYICCKSSEEARYLNNNSKANTQREYTMERVQPSGTTFSETSPLFSTNCHYKSTGAVGESSDVRESSQATANSNGQESVVKDTTLDSEPKKLEKKERSLFINELIKALQYDSHTQLDTATDSGIVCPDKRLIDKDRVLKRQSNSLDVPKTVRGRYLRMSSTLQMIARDPLEEARKELPRKYNSMNIIERTPLIAETTNESDEDESPSTHESDRHSRSSSQNSAGFLKPWPGQVAQTESYAFLIQKDDTANSTDDEDDIAYL